MIINDLIDLLENKQIDDNLDQLIIAKIIDAATIWSTQIVSLKNFVNIFELEVGGTTSKNNLTELLTKYNKSKDEKGKSLGLLITIFDYSGYDNLEKIFNALSEKYACIKPIRKQDVFNIKGYPRIKLFENHFEIKAIDHWEFRAFNYVDLKRVKLVKPLEKWYNRLIAGHHGLTDDIELHIIKKNKGQWEYLTSCIKNNAFEKIIADINYRIDDL